jgi:hypothetical protein
MSCETSTCILKQIWSQKLDFQPVDLPGFSKIVSESRSEANGPLFFANLSLFRPDGFVEDPIPLIRDMIINRSLGLKTVTQVCIIPTKIRTPDSNNPTERLIVLDGERMTEGTGPIVIHDMRDGLEVITGNTQSFLTILLDRLEITPDELQLDLS